MWAHTTPCIDQFLPTELDLIAAAEREDILAFNQLVRAYQDVAYWLYWFAFQVFDHDPD
jgi:hypothetical protein